MKIKYSICTPVYNVEKYLDQCICSVLKQSFSNFELILIDDCSTDNSGLMCDEYANRDKRIRVYHNKESKGSLYSRDFAIKKAKGEYLMFLDSDDYYEDDALQIVNNYLETSNYDLLMFGNNNIVNKKIKSSFSEKETLFFNEEEKRKFLLKVIFDQNYKVLWNKAVKTELLKNIEVPVEDYKIRRGTDKYLSIDIYRLVKNSIIIPNILYNYRIIESGITGEQKRNYTLNYRNRIKLKEFVYTEKVLRKEDLEMFDKFEYKEFRSQISRIGNLSTNKDRKIELFNKIKEENYFKEYINLLIDKYGRDYLLRLFINNRYMTLIFVTNIKRKILQAIKG